MPFYVREFWGDINVEVMSWEQAGIYLRLISLCWTEGSVPADLSELAAILKMDAQKLAEIWDKIERCFKRKSDRLIHKKVEAIRKEKDAFFAKKSAAGKAGNAKRWKDKTSTIAQRSQPDRTAIANTSPPTSDFRSPTSEAAAAAVAADFVSIDDTGWPKFSEVIRSKFPTADDHLIRKIVEETVRVYPPVTDENLVSAFMAASESDRKQYSPALYVQTIPRVIKSWIVPV